MPSSLAVLSLDGRDVVALFFLFFFLFFFFFILVPRSAFLFEVMHWEWGGWVVCVAYMHVGAGRGRGEGGGHIERAKWRRI